jgi:hypothetical protein
MLRLLLLLLGASALPGAVAKPATPFFELFRTEQPKDWHFQPQPDVDKDWLRWQAASTGEPGWNFTTGGRVSVYRPWEVGTRPFVFEFEIDMKRGQSATWRENGVFVMVSSAPVYEMGLNDLGIAIGVMQSGVQAAIKLGPFHEIEWREAWADIPSHARRRFVQYDLAPRGVLSRSGGGGQWQSFNWPGQRLAGQKIRLRMERTDDHYIRFSVFHNAGDPREPVWEGVFQLPDGLPRDRLRRDLKPREIALRYVNIVTTLNNPPGDRSEVRGVDILAGRIYNMVGITAPDTLPEITSYLGPVRDGATIQVRGNHFTPQSVVAFNGYSLETRFINEQTLEARLRSVMSDKPNQLAVGNRGGGVSIFPLPVLTGHAVEAVQPPELREAGGEIITLRGRGFSNDTRVQFNGKPVPVHVISSTELQVKTPPGRGPVDLQVSEDSTRYAIQARVAYARHPYLLIQPDDVKTLRERFNAPHMADYRRMILRLADHSADPATMTLRTVVNPGYGEHIWATVWGYLLTGEERYKAAALRWIEGTVGPNDLLRAMDPTRAETLRIQHEAIGGFTAADPDPSNPGILIQNLNMHQFHIQRGASVAMAYDVLFEELTPELRARMIDYMTAHIDLAVPLIRKGDWWYAGNPSNTVTVANSAVALMALSHKEARDDIQELAELTSRTVKQRFRSIEADGGCVEGTLYWNYGLGAQLKHGIALRNVLGDDFGLLTDERLGKSQDFAQVALGGDGNMFVFNDSQPWLQGTVPAAFAAAQYNQPFMLWLVDAIMARYAHEDRVVGEVVRPTYTIPAFIMRGDQPPVETMPPLPTLFTLGVMQWGVMRSAADAHQQGVVVGIKGQGGQTTHHVHGDQGHFVLHAHGREFFLDAGYGHGSPFKHSIPLPAESDTALKANDGRLPGFQAQNDAPLINVWESGDLRTITVDSTLAYSDGKVTLADKVHRIFVLKGEEALIILDDVVPTGGKPVFAQYQVARKPELISDTHFAVKRDDARADTWVFGPEFQAFQVEPLDINQRGWVYRHMGVDWHRLSGSYRPDEARPFVTVILLSPDETQSGTPQATYGQNTVLVTLPQGSLLRFERRNGNWELLKP